MFSSQKSSLPRRTDSLTIAASSAPKFAEIEEELHDIRRVHNHGQEEDLRMALSRMISRVEELSSMLKEAYRVQTDIQTELTLAKSNLQLALANNEMLEDALNRDVPGSSKDVGWRRWSAKEQKEREMEGLSRRSIDSSHSIDVSTTSPGQSPIPGSTTPSEGRFFKFRFGAPSSASSSVFPSPRLPISPRLGQVQSASAGGQVHTSHLTSASLPSLVSDRDKEMETLTAELEKEKKARVAASAAKEALEAELESLSQALFEEANKMVATERMKLAETEDELREAQAEKYALKSALDLLETQHNSSTQLANGSIPSSPHTQPIHHGRSISAVSTFSASSAMAIKSPPSSSSSAPSSPISVRRIFTEDSPPSAKTVVPTQMADNHESDAEGHYEGDAAPSHDPEAPVDTPPEQADDPAVNGEDNTPRRDKPAVSSLEVLSPSTSSSSSSSSTNPSPSPSGFFAPRPVVFYDAGDAASPWADVRSASASPSGTR
ncbi:hypothetical protein EUX98_g2781 [Antrodiella citrinella]|uniref:GDP/GTP exchange factor Sec2 N-terminal domain-containing protein n=1 Tax=Antrodiella citrinella TaxID=2447956 RepID=A0A4S4MY67_9APHY|nr:hypothetical protein EUX98_g2781 [Antrodiella citrinella]